MSDFDTKFDRLIAKLREEMLDEVQSVKKHAFDDGFKLGVENHKKPSVAQFRREHAEAKDYGEDFAVVVWAPSLKKAQQLLECDPEYVEEMNLSWQAYEYEGEMMTGFVLNRSNNGDYQAYGYWL